MYSSSQQPVRSQTFVGPSCQQQSRLLSAFWTMPPHRAQSTAATHAPFLRHSRPLTCTVRASSSSASAEYLQRPRKDVRVLVVGATGYIGKFVVKELIARGYTVVAFSREKSGVGGKQSMDDTRREFEGADVRFGDVTDVSSLERVAFKDPVDVVVSCLASRTGGIKDSQLVDYQATSNTLQVARKCGASHFVLLSAICVQKPLLEFQRAKLKFETELQAAGDISYSIVRPTAFFKSLAGQVQLVKEGKPYVMFGDGTLAACKPISERDLASYIADCIDNPELRNKVLPIGGPGDALTARDQANLLFRITGQRPNYFPVPVALMDGIIRVFDFLAGIFPQMEVRQTLIASLFPLPLAPCDNAHRGRPGGNLFFKYILEFIFAAK